MGYLLSAGDRSIAAVNEMAGTYSSARHLRTRDCSHGTVTVALALFSGLACGYQTTERYGDTSKVPRENTLLVYGHVRKTAH